MIDAAVRDLVRRRAGDRCEYCRLPQHADEAKFHIEHISLRFGPQTAILSQTATPCGYFVTAGFGFGVPAGSVTRPASLAAAKSALALDS